MSEVISFRLDRGNPREARAREVLKRWYGEGYSVRYVLTEALLKLDEDTDQAGQAQATLLAELMAALERANHLLAQLQTGQVVPAGNGGGELHAELTETFVASVRKGARPGLKMS